MYKRMKDSTLLKEILCYEKQVNKVNNCSIVNIIVSEQVHGGKATAVTYSISDDKSYHHIANSLISLTFFKSLYITLHEQGGPDLRSALLLSVAL